MGPGTRTMRGTRSAKIQRKVSKAQGTARTKEARLPRSSESPGKVEGNLLCSPGRQALNSLGDGLLGAWWFCPGVGSELQMLLQRQMRQRRPRSGVMCSPGDYAACLVTNAVMPGGAACWESRKSPPHPHHKGLM